MRAGLVAVPVNYRFPAATIAFILRDCGAKLVFCDPARRAQCPPGLPVVSFGTDGAESFDAFLDPGPFDAVTAPPDEPAMFLYTSGSTGTPKGVVLSHQSHIWVVETRLEGQDIASQRFLVAAPLYHMNALAVSAFACAGHATIVLLPQFTAAAYIEAIARHRCTFLTAVPPMIAMMLREHELMARTDLSSVAVRAHGLGAGEPEPDAGAASRAAAGQGHQRLRHHRGGAGGVRPASARPAAARDLGRLSASQGRGAARRRRQSRREPGRARDEMPGDDARLSQPARPRRCRSPPTASTAPATCSAATPTVSIISSAAPTTCSSPAARTSIRPTSSACSSATPPSPRPRGADRGRHQGPEAGRLHHRQAGAVDAEEIKRFALANAPAYQHPRFVWFVDRLPLSTTNKIDRAALMRMAAEHLEETEAAR